MRTLTLILLVVALSACDMLPVPATATLTTTMPSPGPGRIAFLSRYSSPGQVYFEQNVLVINSNGGNITNFTKSGFYESPVWSPDGQLIAFANDEVYVTNASGGKL